MIEVRYCLYRKYFMTKKIPRKAGDSTAVAQTAETRVRRALEAGGWSVREGGVDRRIDLLAFKRRRARYAIEVKTLREGRLTLADAYFADAVLRLRADLRPGEKGLVVLVLDRASARVAQRIERYAHDLAQDVDWILLGAEGIVASHGDGLDALRSEFATEHTAHVMHTVRGAPSDLFSDLNQWLIKVLLAPALSPGHMAGPTEHARNARHLAHLAAVSEPTTSRLLTALREGGWVAERESPILLRRVPEFLERWKNARARPDREIGTRFVFPPAEPLKDLRSRLNPWPLEWVNQPSKMPFPPYPGAVVWAETPRACFGLFAALKVHGLGFVHGAPLHVLAERIEARFLDRLRLRECAAGEAVDVYLREPRFPESVFRAVVARGTVPCSDIIQCWLDVSHHPVRGEEQARELLQFLTPIFDAYAG